MPIVRIKDSTGRILYETSSTTLLDSIALEMLKSFLVGHETHAKKYRRDVINYCYDLAEDFLEVKDERRKKKEGL